MSNQSGQPIVVTESKFGGGNCVVLVHDRDCVQRPQTIERPLRVPVLRPSSDVVRREKYLPDGAPVPGERRTPGVSQRQLTDAGCSLLGREIARSLGQSQRRQSGADGTGRDDDDIGTRTHACLDGIGQQIESVSIESRHQTGECRRPDLHDDTVSRRYRLPGGPEHSPVPSLRFSS